MKNKNCDKNSCQRKTSIGGQALIEGIMMRGPKRSAMAVRNPEGEIVLEAWDHKGGKRSRLYTIPVVRGLFNFIETMSMGYKCLMRSAEIAGLEEDTSSSKKSKNKQDAEHTDIPEQATHTSEQTTDKKEKDSSALMTVIMVISTVLGVGLAVFLFLLLPTYIFSWLAKLIPALKPQSLAAASLIKSVFEGLLRIALLVSYMLLVTLMKDIRRTFQYHGAEHKTIFCYENGLELTVENVREQRRFHPRCGTSFLILMLLVGILISFFIDPLFIAISGSVPPALLRSVIKILLLPLTMGIGYELIKLAGRHQNALTRIISAPGMWLQRITVLEPSDDMIECAIAAFVEVIPEDQSDKI